MNKYLLLKTTQYKYIAEFISDEFNDNNKIKIKLFFEKYCNDNKWTKTTFIPYCTIQTNKIIKEYDTIEEILIDIPELMLL